MGDSVNRDLYFETHIKNQRTPEAYLNAMFQSPYRKHRRHAQRLAAQYKILKSEHAKIIEEHSELKQIKEDDDIT